MGLVITLLVAGAVLLALETLLPGLIAGIIGVLCLIAGVVVSYLKFGASVGNVVLLGVVVGLVAGTFLWLRYFPQSAVARLFVSRQVIGDIHAEQPELLNQAGTALTALRPSGMASIQGRRVDVVTEGPWVAAGTPLKVVGVEGMRVVVRATGDAAAPGQVR